jgi:hypothetical protein
MNPVRMAVILRRVRFCRVAPCVAFQYRFAVRPDNPDADARHRLRLVHFEDLHFARDRVADEHGIGEAPARLEKHRTRSGQIHGNDRVQEAAGQASLHDELLETGRRAERGVNVQRVVVAGNLTVEPYLLLRERRRASGLLPHR